jgi:aminoglycoside phosphotransferase (APT) family kinase protein
VKKNLGDAQLNQPLPVEGRIKQYMRKIDPGVLGLSQTAKDVKAKRLGLGESNLNYLVNVDGNQFVFRINMDPRSPNKSKTEFDSLKMVEGLGIAPKAFHYEASKECFGETFVILRYVEAKR